MEASVHLCLMALHAQQRPAPTLEPSYDDSSGSQALMSRGEPELEQPATKFLVLGLGLLFLGRQDEADATLEVLLSLKWRVCPVCCVG